MHDLARRRRERQDRRADIAADLNLIAEGRKKMRDERRRRRFAVGAGDGDERRFRRDLAALAAEELDVADNLDPRLSRPAHDPMRLRVCQRNARGENQRAELLEIGARKIEQRQAERRGFLTRRRLIVPDDDIGAASLQCFGADTARSPEAEDRNSLSGCESQRNHRHLSFNVERPTSASTKAMIQKRTTTCGSDQPSCSKWWWIGAILNTRLPVSLNEMTWTITDSASTTK